MLNCFIIKIFAICVILKKIKKDLKKNQKIQKIQKKETPQNARGKPVFLGGMFVVPIQVTTHFEVCFVPTVLPWATVDIPCRDLKISCLSCNPI